MRNYLITGVAGSGKSTVSEGLAAKGYRVIEFDGVPGKGVMLKAYRQRFDRRTDKPSAYKRGMGWEELKHINWRVDRVKLLPDLNNPENVVQFISGYANNWREFKDEFDGVFLLEVSPTAARQRLLARTNGDWGRKHPEELKHVIETATDFNNSIRQLGATIINSEKPTSEIVAEIIETVQTHG